MFRQTDCTFDQDILSYIKLNLFNIFLLISIIPIHIKILNMNENMKCLYMNEIMYAIHNLNPKLFKE